MRTRLQKLRRTNSGAEKAAKRLEKSAPAMQEIDATFALLPRAAPDVLRKFLIDRPDESDLVGPDEWYERITADMEGSQLLRVTDRTIVMQLALMLAAYQRQTLQLRFAGGAPDAIRDNKAVPNPFWRGWREVSHDIHRLLKELGMTPKARVALVRDAAETRANLAVADKLAGPSRRLAAVPPNKRAVPYREA